MKPRIHFFQKTVFSTLVFKRIKLRHSVVEVRSKESFCRVVSEVYVHQPKPYRKIIQKTNCITLSHKSLVAMLLALSACILFRSNSNTNKKFLPLLRRTAVNLPVIRTFLRASSEVLIRTPNCERN